jgi:hypothetical protein
LKVCKARIFLEQVPEYVVVHLNALTGEAILDLGELADVADVAEKINIEDVAERHLHSEITAVELHNSRHGRAVELHN